MSVLDIVKWPDDRLTQICGPVDLFDPDLQTLAKDMLETMYAAKGRGLAAPQVGVMLRLFVMDATWKTGEPSPLICANPVLTATGEETRRVEELCLSIPDQPRFVTRPACVHMRWNDLRAQAQDATLDGDAATIAQHEADHLDGRLILDIGTLQ